MSELGDDFKEMRNQRRAEVEPKRWAYAIEQLRRLPGTVSAGTIITEEAEGKKITIQYQGKRWEFYPFTGWFNGPVQGRGIKNLCRALGI